MKKLLLSSIVLFVFSLSIIVFQISCKKEVKAQTSTTEGLKQLGKILYKDQTGNYLISNFDGSGKQKLNIQIPSGETAIDRMVLSPDGKKIFVSTYKEVVVPNYEYFHLYSCNLDGSDLKVIISDNTSFEELIGVY